MRPVNAQFPELRAVFVESIQQIIGLVGPVLETLVQDIECLRGVFRQAGSDHLRNCIGDPAQVLIKDRGDVGGFGGDAL